MRMGTAKFYNGAKGYGLIALQQSGKDVSVHATALEPAGKSALSEGQAVSFRAEDDGHSGKTAASNNQLG